MPNLLFFSLVFIGDVWPSFLGSGATSIEDHAVPLRWTPDQGIAWNASLPGHGQSTPIVWNDLVIVTSVDGPKKEKYFVNAFSLSSGKQLWKHLIDSSDPVENTLYISRAAPTPVVDAQRIIAYFESGDVLALDHAGKELWKRSISSEYGKFKNQFGLSSSLAQTANSIFVLVDDEGPSYVLALDKSTGNTVWKQDRASRRSWSSPAVVHVGNDPQLVVSSSGSVDGYDPTNGKLLWSFSDVGGNTGTTPIDLGDRRFFVAASAGREGESSEMAKRSNLLMQIKKTDNGWTAIPLWRNEEASPSWASPIAHRDCAYWVNSAGVVHCLDIHTGKNLYKQRIKQSCWATPVGVGDRVYFFGKSGVTTVLAAGNEAKIITENQLLDEESLKPPKDAGANEPTEERRRAAAMFAGPTVYGVAVAGGRLLFRIGDRLLCVDGIQ